MLLRRVEERYAQVVQHRHAGEGPRDLEAARDAESDAATRRHRAEIAALEADGPSAPQRSGDAACEGALARSVWSDEADALACRDRQIHAVERDESSEALGDPLRDEDRLLHLRLVHPMIPCGATVTKTTSSAPTRKRFQSGGTFT